MSFPDQRFTSKEWHEIAECPDCGYQNSQWNIANAEYCPKCGEYRGTWIDMDWDWNMLVARWIPTEKLFSPRTWGTGYFEFKDDTEGKRSE